MEDLLSLAWKICSGVLVLMGAAFQIAKSTEEERRKVVSWGKSAGYMALLLIGISFGFMSAYGFLTKTDTPTRQEAFFLVTSVLLTVWYIKMFFDYVLEVRSRSRIAEIEKLSAERKQLEEQTLRESIRADTYEAINGVLRVMTGGKSADDTPQQIPKDAKAPD